MLSGAAMAAWREYNTTAVLLRLLSYRRENISVHVVLVLQTYKINCSNSVETCVRAD